MNITQEVHLFRETLRHLWNTYLKRDANWDTVALFNDISLKLFEEQIVSRLGINAPPIPLDAEENYLSQYRIFAEGSGKLPLSVNRDIPPSGYWDYPIEWIPPEKNNDIRPISFFDFDVLGWRKFEYYHVRIIECESNPELNGRDALIPCDYVEIECREFKKVDITLFPKELEEY